MSLSSKENCASQVYVPVFKRNYIPITLTAQGCDVYLTCFVHSVPSSVAVRFGSRLCFLFKVQESTWSGGPVTENSSFIRAHKIRCFSAPENGSRAGFRNVLLHWKVQGGQRTKTAERCSAQSSHITTNVAMKQKNVSLALGLPTYSLAKQIVMTDKALRSSSFFFGRVALNRLVISVGTDHCWSSKYQILWVSLCLCSCLSYPAYKSRVFCTVLYCYLWSVWLYCICHILLKTQF